MGVARDGSQEGFYYRCEGKNSQRHLEEFRAERKRNRLDTARAREAGTARERIGPERIREWRSEVRGARKLVWEL